MTGYRIVPETLRANAKVVQDMQSAWVDAIRTLAQALSLHGRNK